MQTRRAHPFFNLIQGTASLPSILPTRENFRAFFLLPHLAFRIFQRVKKSRFIRSLNEPYTYNIDPHHKLSFVIIAAQIIWFGLGLTLFYDTAESILHWPHLLVVSLSSALMIVTAWFGIRAMMFLSLVTLPGILSMIYFSVAHAMPGDNPLAQWTQMISGKSVEYLSGMFIVMGSCMGTFQTPEKGDKKKMARITFLAILGFVIGNGLVCFSGVHAALAAGETNLSNILSQQGPTVLGLCLLGLSARSAKNDSFSGCGRVVASMTKIPLRLVVVLVGTGCAVFSDWYSQYMVGWLQYASMLVPPLALLLMGKFFFRHTSKI